MSIILLIILLWDFFFIFSWVFNNFKLTDIFFQNIRRYISDIFDISVKSKYRYIRNYWYFRPWPYDTYDWLCRFVSSAMWLIPLTPSIDVIERDSTLGFVPYTHLVVALNVYSMWNHEGSSILSSQCPYVELF